MMEIAILVLFLVGAWLWVDSMRARESAIDAGRRACDAENVQLLDWTVALKRIRIARDFDGRLRLQRTYEFEYSDTGNNRLKGALTMHGSRLVTVHLQTNDTLPSNIVRLH